MFSDNKKGHRQLLADFIKCYESEPCLWNTKSKEYHDKGKKNVAYAKLLRIYRLLEPRADRFLVVKKINILRTNHRKEKKKVEESKRSGSNIHVPRLWYYDLFEFLEALNNPSGNNVNKKEDVSVKRQTYYVDEKSVSEDSHLSNITINEVHSLGARPTITSAECVQNLQSSQLTSHELQILSEKPQMKPPKRSSPDESYSNNYQEQENNFKKPKWGEDRYQLFATNVTLKMKDIRNDTQRLLAEKMINEALFRAEMGQLSMSHSITLIQNYYGPQPAYHVNRPEVSHNGSNRPQTSTFETKNEIVTSPDCTSQYENEDHQYDSCQSCGRTNRPSFEVDEDSKDPLLYKN